MMQEMRTMECEEMDKEQSVRTVMKAVVSVVVKGAAVRRQVSEDDKLKV